jgi:integrase
MPKLLLTDISIRALKSETRVDYWDTKTPGFGIRVGPRGKTFILKQGGTRRTVGSYPALGLQEARKQAFTFKGEGKPTASSKMTFEAAYEKFKAEHIARKKKSTQRDYRRVLDRYLLPEFTGTALVKITYEAITEITDELADTPSEQAHVLAVGRTFFKWCARPPRRYISHSPLEGLQLHVGKSRKRVLTDAELAQVWRAAEAQGFPHGTVIQLLILNGQRKSEIGSLSRPWIDAKARTITLPEAICKNNTEHTFPYGAMTAAIIESVPRRNSTDFLFPSRYEDDKPFSGWSKFKTELNDGCAHWTLHDLRRTFATKMAELRVAPHVVERLLNHKLGSIQNRTNSVVSAVAEVYNRWAYLPEMREAIEKWETHLEGIIAAQPEARAA